MLILAEFSTSMWILIFAIALIPIFCGSKYRCEHRRKPSVFLFFAVLLTLGIVLLCFLGLPSVVLRSAHRNYGEHEAHAIQFSEAESTKSASHSHDASLNALWDKLTKSRINLDGETDSDPIADPEDEAIKHAVGKTFGLDEKGKLPPSWVINPPKRVGQVLRESVASDPFVTEAECRRQLEQEILPHAVARQIGFLASAKMGHSVTIESPLAVGVGLDYIFREICRDEFTTTVESPSVGEMKKTHVLLEYNPSVDRYLADAWLRSERHARLAHFGKIAGLSLTGLAVAYGLLRFDTWSRGYYSKQLLVGSILAIIAVAVVYLQT